MEKSSDSTNQSIVVAMNLPLFGENTTISIDRNSFLKALEWQDKENKTEIGSYPIPQDTEKFVMIRSVWDTETRTTYKFVVLRNTDPNPNIQGFSIHYSRRYGNSDNRIIVDFSNQASVEYFCLLCPEEMKASIIPAETISSVHNNWILKKEQYKGIQPISIQITFKNNPPCERSPEGEVTLTPKKLKDILDIMNKIDMIDHKTLSDLYIFFDIPAESELSISRYHMR